MAVCDKILPPSFNIMQLFVSYGGCHVSAMQTSVNHSTFWP